MPIIEIVTGAAGSGKSEWCRTLLREYPGSWLILPSGAVQAQWRFDTGAEAPGLKTLYDLASQLAGPLLDGRELVTPAFRLLILRRLVRERVTPGDYLGPVAHTAGFVRRLADLLSQLKQAEVDAQRLAATVRIAGPHLADSTFLQKGEEIAALQRLYMQFLAEHRLLDADDLLALAIRRAGERPETLSWPPAILVDGFFGFTPLQLSLLQTLAVKAQRFAVTLPYDDSRPVLFAYPAETLRRLRERFPDARMTALPGGNRRARAGGLRALEQHLFRDPKGEPIHEGREGALSTNDTNGHEWIGGRGGTVDPAPYVPTGAGDSDALRQPEQPVMATKQPRSLSGDVPDGLPQTYSCPCVSFVDNLPSWTDPVRVYEAPDTLMQVEMVGREIRRLLDHGGYRAKEICVLARSVGEVAPVIRPVFARYGIPVWLNVGERLGENPFVACVSTLLRVWLSDWRREELLRFLRSPYLGLNRFAVHAFERKARRLGIQQGRARWLAAVSETGDGRRETGGENEERCPLDSRVPSPVSMLLRLAGWQDRLSGSAEAQGIERPRVEFEAALGEAIADLGLLEGMRRGEAAHGNVDECAWKSALNVLEDLSRLARLSGGRPQRFAAQAEAAMTAWAEGFFNLPPNAEDRVQVLEVYDARGRDFRAAFILGLVEGVFPRQPREDPCFRDAEREALSHHGGISLPLSMAQADEERLLFYQAISTPREKLFLCYPRTDDRGGATLRSFFLDEVEQAVPVAPKVLSLADAVPDPEEAVLPRERLACLAAALGDGQQPDDPGALETLLAAKTAAAGGPYATGPEPLRRLYQAVREERPEQIERLLSSRNGRRPYQLLHPSVRAHWRARRRAYTVYELEAARACPFQHYLEYRLRLSAAVPGAGPLDQGQMVHEALRRFFSQIGQGGCPEPDEALQRLRTICREIFDETPLDARPYRVRLAEGAVLRYLEGFVRRELEYRRAALLEPAHFEFAFGPQTGTGDEPDPAAIADRGPTDAASTTQPLVLRVGDREVRLSGKIDRIDRMPDGHALVLDYKLGKAPTLKEMREGRSLQLPVYWLAVQQLLGLTPVGGAYDAMREGARPVIARCDLADQAFADKSIIGKNALGKLQFEQILEQTRDTVAEVAALIERLEIAPSPVERTTCEQCAFRDCCRPEDAGVQFDQEPEGADDD